VVRYARRRVADATCNASPMQHATRKPHEGTVQQAPWQSRSTRWRACIYASLHTSFPYYKPPRAWYDEIAAARASCSKRRERSALQHSEC
jgi:hypothetical protein